MVQLIPQITIDAEVNKKNNSGKVLIGKRIVEFLEKPKTR
jgi:hypothetical protein